MNPYIIAEIGSNWNKGFTDNLQTAKEQIRHASECGASAVKFQLFTAYELYGSEVEGTKFEKKFDKYALPQMYLPKLKSYCDELSIDFLCTAFSVEGYKIVDEYVNMHKLASSEVFDRDICDWLFSPDQSKPVIYSNGCGDINPLLPRPFDIPLDCVSDYPASMHDYSLEFDRSPRWGVSDHTLDNTLASIAYDLGAMVFEKHVDFLQGGSTPDSCVSIGKEDFKKYVDHFCQGKKAKRKLYGRRFHNGGYYRPIPEGADLDSANV